MIYLSGIERVSIQGDTIDMAIPQYHRAATGLMRNSKYYLVPNMIETDKGPVREVIVTPFKPHSWQHIWKVSIRTDDRPGVIKGITDVLSEELNINILIQENYTIANPRMKFTLNLIVDLSHVSDTRILSAVQTSNWIELKSILQEILGDRDRDHEVLINLFEPIHFLHYHSDSPTHPTPIRIVTPTRLKQHYFHQGYPAIPVKKKSIQLDRSVLYDLGLLGTRDPSIDAIECTMFSDSEEKFFVIRFFRKDQHIVFLQIVHRNDIGAIHAFTKTISEIDDQYNIISSYNRIEQDDLYSVWNVLLDVTDNPSKLPHLISALGQLHVYAPKVEIWDWSMSLAQMTSLKLGATLRSRQLNLQQDGERNELNVLRNEVQTLVQSIPASITSHVNEAVAPALQKVGQAVDTFDEETRWKTHERSINVRFLWLVASAAIAFFLGMSITIGLPKLFIALDWSLFIHHSDKITNGFFWAYNAIVSLIIGVLRKGVIGDFFRLFAFNVEEKNRFINELREKRSPKV